MKQRRIAAVLAGSLMTVAMGAYVAPVAHADNPTPEPVFSGEQQDAIAYWTPERMRSAKDISVTRDAGDKAPTSQVEVGKERVIRAASASNQRTNTTKSTARSRSTVGRRWTNGGKVVKTTGKVFFTIPRGEPEAGNYVCSGSVAPANNKAVIITAGHCVNDANAHVDAHDGKPGKYVTNWVFVPGYNGRAKTSAGRTPYGVYAATSLLANTRWIHGADFNYDVGFATVGGQTRGKTPGALVGNAQGSQGLGFNLPRHHYVENFGYPAARPYDGTVLDYSAGAALNADANGPKKGNSSKKDDPGGSKDQVVNSNLTGGSSGGPWFYNFHESSGAGTQMSVNSFSYLRLTKKQRQVYKIPKRNMWGPYFGSAIERMFDSVQGRRPRAASKSATTPEDTATKVTLSGTKTPHPNKSVPTDPRPLTYKIKAQPSHGTVTRRSNVATYTPKRNFYGTDKFTYVANNGVNNSAPATVTVKVTPVNDPPKAANVSGHTRIDKPVDITLKGSDADKGAKLTYHLASQPSDGGTVTIHKNGVATYTPAAGTGATGSETVTFRYTVSDGHVTSRPATVTIDVSPNSAPIGQNDRYSVDAGHTLSVKAPGVLRNDTDADDDPLEAVLVEGVHGLDFHSDGSFSYDAPKVYKDKTVSFTYRATDNVDDSGNQVRALAAPQVTRPDESEDVTVTISVAAATRPSPKPSPTPTQPPSSANPSQPPASAPPSSQAPNGPLGDTGSPFSPVVIGFGLLTVAAGAGTLIAARLRRQ